MSLNTIGLNSDRRVPLRFVVNSNTARLNEISTSNQAKLAPPLTKQAQTPNLSLHAIHKTSAVQ